LTILNHLHHEVLRRPVDSALAAVIAMEHDTADVAAAAALPDGCCEGISDQLGAHVPGQ
jgi:hypothetical protein